LFWVSKYIVVLKLINISWN